MNTNSFRHRAISALVTMCFAALLVGNAFAQSGTSTINGVVTDQTGAAVPGATVTVKNPATGFTRSTTTRADGRYSFPGIAPASYTIEVEAANFKKALNTSVQASSSKRVSP